MEEQTSDQPPSDILMKHSSEHQSISPLSEVGDPASPSPSHLNLTGSFMMAVFYLVG